MSTPNAWQVPASPSSTEYFDESLRQHMLRVYNYMGGGLVLTGIVAFFVASTPAIYQPLFGTPLKCTQRFLVWVVALLLLWDASGGIPGYRLLRL
jgi:FtsH-binding integral membrane protein